MKLLVLERQIHLAHFPLVLYNIKDISAVGGTMCTECWVKSWPCEFWLPVNYSCLLIPLNF